MPGNNHLKINPKNILIIRLSSLGDIIHCLPVSYNLKKYYPKACVTWVVRERYAELLTMDTSLDEIIAIKDIAQNKLLSRIREIIKIIKLIREKRFDAVLDLHCALITNIISVFSCSPVKFGIDKRNELGFKILKYSPLSKSKETHRINAYLSLLKLFGIYENEIKYSFSIPDQSKNKALNLLKEIDYTPKETIIAIHPGTALMIKNWGIAKFAKIASILSTQHDCKVIIIYGENEKYCEKDTVIKLFNHKVGFAFCPNIEYLTALIERCDLLIGNDSGPIHLAAALKIPTVSIFGPSNHLVSRPLGDKHKVVRKDLPCSPCYGRFSVRFKCKNKNRQECLKSISVEDVLNAVEPTIKEITDVKQKKAAGK